jgi:hypothetical protein
VFPKIPILVSVGIDYNPLRPRSRPNLQVASRGFVTCSLIISAYARSS